MISKRSLHHQKIVDLYDVINIVGVGTFGIVIACHDRIWNKRFALKIASIKNQNAAASL